MRRGPAPSYGSGIPPCVRCGSIFSDLHRSQPALYGFKAEGFKIIEESFPTDMRSWSKNMKLTEIPGVGPKTEALFAKLLINDCESLTRYYPLHYDSYEEPVPLSDIRPGKKITVRGTVTGAVNVFSAGNKKILGCVISDGQKSLKLVWYNALFIRSVLKKGCTYCFRGNISVRRGTEVMEHPEIFRIDQYREKQGGLLPVYGLTKGLSNNAVVKAVRAAFELCGAPDEYLPEQMVRHYGLMDEKAACEKIHFPANKEELTKARKRIAFDEFFFFILALRMLKSEEKDAPSDFPMKVCWETEDLIDALPYRLTGAQERVFREIEADLSSGKTMSRLIQGDVGSGKTVLAFLALVMAARNGYQGALLVPTEVLARQHFEKFVSLTESVPDLAVHAVLLTGSLKPVERRKALAEIRSGEADVVIGTHALIQDAVEYHDLALVVTDEQHRFGVYQRKALTMKGRIPHMLVMSATPIPRTLGVIYYGDLDISIVDERPAARLPIRNCVVDESWRPNAMRFLEKELSAGHQVYVVCPMIEENEEIRAENVIDRMRELRKIFPDYPIAMLHGRMKPDEKNRIMEDFAAGKVSILVSTTVIEVGVDVPNATVMMIENAERFGLAALHQLRGRVGRGEAQSYCIFMAGQQSGEIRERLSILNESNDGFRIAEKDFELRGPGDLLGIRQSGEACFRAADPVLDRDVLKAAGELAAVIMQDDPMLVGEEYAVLKKRIKEYISESEGAVIL